MPVASAPLEITATYGVNAVYWPLWTDDSRYKIIYGGRRSGKSWFVSQSVVMLCAENPGRRICVTRKVGTTIRNTVWRRTLNALQEVNLLGACKVNKSDREIIFPNGSEIVFVGADDPEKLKSMEDVTDWWLEEATDFEEADFDTIDAGLSAVCEPPAQIFLTFNPIPTIEGVPHWIQKRFMLGIEPELGVLIHNQEAAILRTYFMHNAKCPERVQKLLLSYKTSNPDLWRMWGLGLFTRMKGAIIKKWDRVESVPHGIRFLGYGLDFGFAMDPAAVVAVWRKPGHLWLKQLVYEEDLDNQDLSRYMREVGMNPDHADIVADSAEPKSIRELQKLGWMVSGARKGQNYKPQAALWARGMHWHIVDPSPNLVTEVASWSWKWNRSTEKYMPLPSDDNNHGIDCVIYRAYREQGGVVTSEQAAAAATDEIEALGDSDDDDPTLEALL